MSEIKNGMAKRIIFYYPKEEGTYMDNVYVSLHDNGLVNFSTEDETGSTHISNCEILWTYIGKNVLSMRRKQ